MIITGIQSQGQDIGNLFVPKDALQFQPLWVGGYVTTSKNGNNISLTNQSPTQVGTGTNWKSISDGASYTIHAIKTNGTLWGWGGNGNGELGNGTAITYSSPVQVGTLSNWIIVKSSSTAVNNSSVGLQSNNTLWVWGNNVSGQLGNGTTINYSSPIQIGTLSNWKNVSVNGRVMSGIDTLGKLWIWGTSVFGQLGNGTTIAYSSPIQVGTLSNWTNISCGYLATLALQNNGTAWAWGRNYYGQLGNGTTIDYSSPIQIGTLSNWTNISCGYSQVLINNLGQLWTCGQNTYGQLGNGTTIAYSSPIQVGTLTNWKTVTINASAGGNMNALKTDGTWWACGYVAWAASLSYSSPIQVGSLSTWKFIDGGCGIQSF